eukprot:TRINITY_DN3360_c0_g2_i1.p1 TRINITY_DN3360_c0_g2~~TRINITY_DN3360_c0_g2_i1.p1  ORF type:complete len:183 (+),score=31.32 TRINITY_DN3360_c0_g2_i1:133-681(+)
MVISSLIVLFGFILGCIGDPNLSLLGTFYGVLTCFFSALYISQMKNALQYTKDNHWELLMYNLCFSVVIMIPLMALTDEPWMVSQSASLDDERFWHLQIIAGFLVFASSFSNFVIGKYTPTIAYMTTIHAKMIIQTLIAFWILKSDISFQGFIGVLLIMSGSFWFHYTRHQQNEQKLNDDNV